MESVRKRKASVATPSTSDGASATKKLKLLNSTPSASSSNAKVQEVGYKVIRQLEKATDKHGRPIADLFLELPDREELPDYYEFTKLPIAIDTIKGKLDRNEYSTVTAIESDFKRMVQNAKDYNDPKSEVFEDAEKIRKLVFNFMKQHNPAYSEQPGYSAVATPIANASRTSVPAPSRSSAPSERKPSAAPSATIGDAEMDADGDVDEDGEEADGHGDDLDFTNKTFQEAQQMILSHLLQYKDDEGLLIYTPFANLPSRKLEDYYKTIRHPVCIRGVAKRARGQHGRLAPTGITDFKTWDAFSDEASHIWRNAKAYNEDGSEMYTLAIGFEKHFKSLLEDAKSKVDEPSAPKIKLGGPKPKVTLNLSQRQTPTPNDQSISVDRDALQRQRQAVQAGMSGNQPTPPPRAVSTPGPQATTTDAARPTSSAHSGSPSVNGAVKSEIARATASPAPNGILRQLSQQPHTNGIMPPPATRPLSASPFPPGAAAAASSSLSTSTTAVQQNSYQLQAAASIIPPAPRLVAPPVRPYPLSSVLLPTVTLSTQPRTSQQHQYQQPQPQQQKLWTLTVQPHEVLSHQSRTVTLPQRHNYLQISPTISRLLSMGRPYKMFVTLNGARLTQRDTQFHSDSGRRTHVYEGTLALGVNRVEVEVAAAAAAPAASPLSTGEDGSEGKDGVEGADAAASGAGGAVNGAGTDAKGGAAPVRKGLDVEKVTVFVHLTQ